MTGVDAIGYAAFVANVAGNLMLARMNIWGWMVRLVTNIAWIAYAVQIPGGAPMWLNHAAFFWINIYGFLEWRKQLLPAERGLFGPGVGTLEGLECPGIFRHESGAIISIRDITEGDERILEVVRRHQEREHAAK